MIPCLISFVEANYYVPIPWSSMSVLCILIQKMSHLLLSHAVCGFVAQIHFRSQQCFQATLQQCGFQQSLSQAPLEVVLVIVPRPSMWPALQVVVWATNKKQMKDNIGMWSKKWWQFIRRERSRKAKWQGQGEIGRCIWHYANNGLQNESFITLHWHAILDPVLKNKDICPLFLWDEFVSNQPMIITHRLSIQGIL